MRKNTLVTILLALVATTSPLAAQDSREATQSTAPGRETVRIAAGYNPGDIVVSLADRRLYHVRSRGKAVAYPIATPRDQDMWTGSETVTRKQVNPSWRPTPTMLRANPRLPTFVPGGHRLNPMGARALYLGNTYYRIHGTDAPWLIGKNVSKGCIRMHNAHVIELFDKTRVGTKVMVVEASLSDPGNQTALSATAARLSRSESGS